jgi:hypothetical protein
VLASVRVGAFRVGAQHLHNNQNKSEETMNAKIVIPALLAAIVAVPTAAIAGEKAASGAQQAQQQRMKACNAQAKSQGLKGDERKTYMSSCLKGGHQPDGGSDDARSARRQ